MKILVLSINSAEFESRRKAISEKLEGYDWSFFDAFDARKLEALELFKLFDKDAFYEKYHRHPSSGEVGCTLSHISIYNFIVDNNLSEVLILEDDAIIDADFEVFFSRIDTFKFEDDVFVLGHSKVSRKNGWFYNFVYPLSKVKRINNYSFGMSKYLTLCGTVAYIITNEAAKKVLNNSSKCPYHLADDWRYFCDIGVRVYHARPLLILEDFLSFESSIESERKTLQRVEQAKVVQRDVFFASKKGTINKLIFGFILISKSIIKKIVLNLS